MREFFIVHEPIQSLSFDFWVFQDPENKKKVSLTHADMLMSGQTIEWLMKEKVREAFDLDSEVEIVLTDVV